MALSIGLNASVLESERGCRIECYSFRKEKKLTLSVLDIEGKSTGF